MNIGIIQFPGTNCQRETALAVSRAGMKPSQLLWHTCEADVSSMDGYVIAGGFSYEDRGRSGIIAAQDPMMKILCREALKGKPIIGICNGAQILLESGMVPGLSGIEGPPEAALTTNRRIKEGKVVGTGYYNTWSTLLVSPGGARRVFTSRFTEGECITVPIAHGEGRFLFPEETARMLTERDMVPFRYADESGTPRDEFPVNPNGSMLQAAGITNREGTILALMPHPERTIDGDRIFQSMAGYIRGGITPIDPSPVMERTQYPPLETYEPSEASMALVIRQIITDNEAISVESAVTGLGISTTLQRRIHWEIQFEPDTPDQRRRELMEIIHASGELYNSNKEQQSPPSPRDGAVQLLIREREDPRGMHSRQSLVSRFGCREIKSIKRGILWSVRGDVQGVLDSHILMNPHAYKGYSYENR